MADGRRKKGTSKHEGVVLIQRPSGSWYARFKDPDTGQPKSETLPSALTTEEQRTAWAIVKAGTIRGRAALVASGAPTKKHVSLASAVETYFSDVSAGLRPRTLKLYREATDALLAWAKGRRLDLADDLRGEDLAALRSHVANQPLRQWKSAKKGKAPTERTRSPARINSLLRPIKTVLSHLRKLGLVPLLGRDAITDNLASFPEPRPVPRFLKPAALVKLIEAASRHDEETFDLTREEKDHGSEGGTTSRYAPVLPYLSVLVLSGMRADEGRLLAWDRVDLDAPPAGAIVLEPRDTKTNQGRQIDLVVSDVLRELLVAAKLRTGGTGYVFGGERAVTRDTFSAARRRLVASYGAPPFSWQRLRMTCGTFLTNAPGIFGAASAYRSAKQLGHSVTVAEKHYLDVVHVSPEAKTLEAAMGVERVLREALGLGGATERGIKKASEG